jgi:hypothetical protein
MLVHEALARGWQGGEPSLDNVAHAAGPTTLSHDRGPPQGR